MPILYMWSIKWILPNNPSHDAQTWTREAPTARDALDMWKEEEFKRFRHPDNQPIVLRMECHHVSASQKPAPSPDGPGATPHDGKGRQP